MRVGGNAAVLGESQRDFLAIARYRCPTDQPGIDEALDVLGHRSLELAGTCGQRDDVDRLVGDVVEQVGSMAGANITLPAGILRSAGIRLAGLGPGSVPFEVLMRARSEFLPRLFAMVAAGELQLTTQRRPLADVEAAWTQREPSGTRVVFTP